MSLFGLFGKKEKPVRQESPHIDTPWGPLFYNGIKYQRYEYEGLVDWCDEDDECDIVIECIAEGSDDMGGGFDKFASIMNSKEDIDYQVKMAVLEKLSDENGFILTEKGVLASEEQFLGAMSIGLIEIKRDGSVEFGIFNCVIGDERDVIVRFPNNGTAEVTFGLQDGIH